MNKKPPDKSNDYFKCIKTSLKHVIKNDEFSKIITETAIKANKIVIHTLQFIKLYLIDYYDKNNKLPTIDKTFINSCMKIICKEKTTGRPPSKKVKELKDELKVFYDNYYKKLTQNEELDYQHMNTILDYLTIDILTMYENNIKQHYVEYVERYVNVVWKKKFMIEKIKKIFQNKEIRDKKINNLCKQLRYIKNDLLNVDNDKYKSLQFYHQWIEENKKKILPQNHKFEKNSVYYDLQCNPQKYFDKMVYMMKCVGIDGEKINNVFPLRSEIIPKYIRIDTTTLVHLLMTKKQGNKTDYLFNGNLKRNEDKIWKFFFRTERKCFRKQNYSFHHMIETDGVGCSILLLRNDLIGKKIKVPKNKSMEKYIDDLVDFTKLKNKKIVAIDPNMSDLLYCVDNSKKDRNHMRYTQDQRKKETKQKKYKNIIFEQKDTKIEGKSVIEWETILSKYNRKSLNYTEFSKYIQKKNEVNNKLFAFYQNYLFRKLKLNSYINRKKSEQWFMNKFEKIFGKPNDVIIGIGDFEQKKHRKFKEPVKGKGFRTLLRKNKYDVYLVDEFRTSCRCSNCEGGECKKFRTCENPRPWRNEIIYRNGLLMCKTCNGLWNRDENSSRNIHKIMNNIINGLDRPSYLSRTKQVNGTTSVSYNQNLHEDEKPQP